MLAINTALGKLSLIQEEAAKLVNLNQSELSRLSNGRGSGFSVEQLLFVLCGLGRDIEIVVTPAQGPVGEILYREAA